jgi:hypothetical protein
MLYGNSMNLTLLNIKHLKIPLIKPEWNYMNFGYKKCDCVIKY